MKSDTFQRILRAASALNPYGKKLTDDDLLITWMTLAPRVQQEVTDEMWLYALQQHRMDPAPNKELPLDMQLLKHVWKCENGAPCLRWGPKADLAQRMALPGQFHGQPASPYELGEDLGSKEPQLAPQGVLATFGEAA